LTLIKRTELIELIENGIIIPSTKNK